ncbi:MAG TPA: GGDEF domain-containing protein [Candidatus Deferrimicrobiaceae bacterium]|nr:GGDEF domain-containing protein [Candidatus Deferrimicrobiaceae bacterium]
MGVQNLLLAGLIFAIAGASACLLMARRSRFESSAKIQDLETRIGELNAMMLELKLEKSQAVQTAEQIPVVVQKMTEHLPIDSYFPVIVRYAKEITNSRKVGYFAPLPDSEYYTLKVGYGFPEDWRDKVRIARDEGALGLALQKRIVLTREDFETSGIEGYLPSLEGEGIEPDLVAPVQGISGIEGVLVIAGCTRPPGELKVPISMLVDLLSLSIQNAMLLEFNERGVYSDDLTGLANRFHFARIFETEIRRAWNYQRPLSLLVFDLDRFKDIIDSWGHPAGDEVLQAVARITKSCTRSSHIVARYGGDEFVVLLPSTNKDQAFLYAENLRKQIAETEIPIGDRNDHVTLTISGGIACFPENGQSTADLIQAADHALSEAKKGGKNRIVLFQPAESAFDSGIAQPADGTEIHPPLEEHTGSG